MLNIDTIEHAIERTIFRGKLHAFDRIESTNSTAMAEAHAGAPEGSVYLANEQTAGRGRGGHSWHSEPNAGIYLSAVLRPQMQPSDVLPLSLLAGLAVQAAIREVTSLTPDLRWPNDVLLDGKKFCGILAEMNSPQPSAERRRDAASVARVVVVGIGINVNHASFPEELAPIATSLRVESGREWQREEIVAAVLRGLHEEYAVLTSGAGRAAILRRFELASSYARGKRVHVEESGGYTGVTEGLDEQGFLRVRTADGLRTVLNGGVREIATRPAIPC